MGEITKFTQLFNTFFGQFLTDPMNQFQLPIGI